jgi:hypothetical protein
MTEKENKHVPFLLPSANEIVGYSNEALNSQSSCLGEVLKPKSRSQGLSGHNNARNSQHAADVYV